MHIVKDQIGALQLQVEKVKLQLLQANETLHKAVDIDEFLVDSNQRRPMVITIGG